MINLRDIKKQLSADETLSLYLNVDSALHENQAENPLWRKALKRALFRIEHNLPDAEREVWAAARDRAVDFLDNFTPRSKGLVLFTTPYTDHVYELPYRVETHAQFGQPWFEPLRQMEAYEPHPA